MPVQILCFILCSLLLTRWKSIKTLLYHVCTYGTKGPNLNMSQFALPQSTFCSYILGIPLQKNLPQVRWIIIHQNLKKLARETAKVAKNTFFSMWVFFHEHWRFTGQQVKRGDHPYSFLPPGVQPETFQSRGGFVE